MAYIVNGERVMDVPLGVFFQFEHPCDDLGGHEYAHEICPVCGRDFCWACAAGADDQGRCTCPDCGWKDEDGF